MELTNRSVVRNKPSREHKISKKRIPRHLHAAKMMPHTQMINVSPFQASSLEVDVHLPSSPGVFTIEEVRNTNQKLIRDRNFLATNTGSRSKLIEEITLKLNQKINRESINDAYFKACKALE